MPLVKGRAQAGRDTGQDIGKQRTRGAAARGASQLLMIKSCDHLDDIAFAGVDQGRDARMHAAQVVQSCGGQELLMRSEDCGSCGVVHPDVVAINVGGRATSSSRHMIKNMNAGVANTPDRCGVELLVEPEALVVHAAIKMDGQL